jgi:2'-5' RNA ligase
MPRLFTGVELPPDVALDLSIMRGGIEGARWIDPESYHVTLRFMGDIPEPWPQSCPMS